MSPVVNLGSMCVHFMCACVDTGLLLYWILRFLKDCIQFVKWNPAHIDDDLMHFEETMPVWGPASSGFWDQSCFHPLSISSLWIWGPGLPSGLLEALHQTVFLPLKPSSGIRDKGEPVEIQVKLLQILPGSLKRRISIPSALPRAKCFCPEQKFFRVARGGHRGQASSQTAPHSTGLSFYMSAQGVDWTPSWGQKPSPTAQRVEGVLRPGSPLNPLPWTQEVWGRGAVLRTQGKIKRAQRLQGHRAHDQTYSLACFSLSGPALGILARSKGLRSVYSHVAPPCPCLLTFETTSLVWPRYE